MLIWGRVIGAFNRGMSQLLTLVLAFAALMQAPALAQSGSYMLGPGSNVDEATEVKEDNCVTSADGSITCNTKLVNPATDTMAQPQFEPFSN